MNEPNTTARFPSPSSKDLLPEIAELVSRIVAEFEVAMGSPSRVKDACDRLFELLEKNPSCFDQKAVERLGAVVGIRSGAIVQPLFDFLERGICRFGHPWVFLEGMFNAREKAFTRRALEKTLQLIKAGEIQFSPSVLQLLGEKVMKEGSTLGDPDQLEMLAEIVRSALCAFGEKDEDPLLNLYLQPADIKLRQFAARLLDASGKPASEEVVCQVLGTKAAGVLAPYLAFTRASHLDLIYLVPVSDADPICLDGIRGAEKLCGEQLLRDVLSELGWRRVNFGLEAIKVVGMSISGSFPLILSPAEATLIESVDETRRTGEYFIFTAHGGLPAETRGKARDDDLIVRFRSYNLTHSEVLADILDVAPLSKEKVEAIVEKMDRIVRDFTILFSPYAEECSILPGLYEDLKNRILRELQNENSEVQLSAELTRLVQMFEDPPSLGAVRTLHGLKRYLHQRGLRLGFRLVETSRATNRTVTIVLASSKRILHISGDIQYVDFGSEKNISKVSEIPYSVKVVVDGFSRQIVHGQQRLPGVKVFCYGNEVHYYLSFLNHPAFLRIDYSPPLRGGMIDLEYYGVSKNELDIHPNISLEAIQQFFLKLEFDVQVENTRVHARYDKERALSLGDIAEKAEALFRLVPYLMEVDWVIGFLDLSEDARKEVADAWATFFLRWGVLPVEQFLSRNRQGILVGIESGTAGEREIIWSGESPYRDRFSRPVPAGLYRKLRAVMHELGLEVDPRFEEGSGQEFGQIYLESVLLLPLRSALMRGEIVESTGGYQRRDPDLFIKMHEAEFFAEILAAENEASAVSPAMAAIMSPLEGDYPIPLGVKHSSFLLAHLVAPLERTLRFQTSGSVNGYEVQRASMALCGKTLGLYVLRDGAGIIRLAMFSHGDLLYMTRPDSHSPWRSNGSTDPAVFAELLWLNNYLTSGMESVKTDVCIDVDEALSCFERINPLQRPHPIPGDNVIEGLRASPGRAVGKTLFGTKGRVPEDFVGAILVAPFIRPEDNTFLYHSAGVVSIGGGILSHAGLIAVQFRKPAMIISARWQDSGAGTPVIFYSTVEYTEEETKIQGYHVSIRRDVHKRERTLREGDLVVLDADEGILRVLGQDREVLSLHESIRHFGEASRRLAQVEEEQEILVLRGRKLRARHHIEKHLTQVKDLVLAHHVVQELFVGKDLTSDGSNKNEKSRFLSLLLANRHVGESCAAYIVDLSRNLRNRCIDRVEEAKQRIPISQNLYEVLSLRLQVMRLFRALQEASASLTGCGLGGFSIDSSSAANITALARNRLEVMRRDLFQTLQEIVRNDRRDPRLRHLIRKIQRLDTVLDTPLQIRQPVDSLKEQIIVRDENIRRLHRDRLVLKPEDGGFELYTLIGWKAANLAEIERLGGRHLVPAWFVVTDRAFQMVLDSPLAGMLGSLEGFPAGISTLIEGIDWILAREDLNNLQKSRQIRQLWEKITIPQEIADQVLEAYAELSKDAAGDSPSGEGEGQVFVAIRSSGREEDTETATRAGEFETFLYVRGGESVIEHLKRAWSGLWTERAIHNRTVLGTPFHRAGGGIIIQRNAWSRVSGVLQTVNIAEDKLREMVINVGLGLGEGIVSGTVAADQIVVAKTDNLQTAPLRFRYITSDKREQVIFNARAGFGTIRSPTLYHQRLRAALEYVELAELVRVADQLENAYGYPLDIEFGIEGTKLWILQARPVGTFLALIRETTQRYPLSVQTAAPA